MTWLALADQKSHAFHDAMKEPMSLERGTVMIEASLTSQSKPQTLLGLTLQTEQDFDFAINAMPKGGIHLLVRQGQEMVHAALIHDTEEQNELFRISYAWDLPAQKAHLVIERPGTQTISRRVIDRPLGLSPRAIEALVRPSNLRQMAEDVVFAAISDQVEPIGPMPAICPTAPVLTPTGPRPAGELQRGDLVMTLQGEAVPVLQTLRRTVPAKGSFEPVRLRAPYFGLQKDIVVTPEARLVVGGSQVEYLFGADNVLVPVKHLTADSSARIEEGHKLVTYVQLLLPDHEAIIVGGTALESLGIGRIRRKKDLVGATILAQFDPSTLPEHPKTAFPVLKHYEAVTLAHLRAA